MSLSAIEARYPLSPLQQGMLYHALAAPGSGVDIEQLIWCFHERVDARALEAAWCHVVRRHAVLRTAFRGDEQPMQEVWAEAPPDFVQEDLREGSPPEREARLADFLRDDRQRGLAMDRAPLMRLTLLHFCDQESRLVWTFHHALLDGRSFPIVLREVAAFYEAERTGRALTLPAPRPFRDFVEWLQTLDPSGSESFWREKLLGFAAPTPLVISRLGGAVAAERADRDLRLSSETTAALREFAAAQEVTLNTLVQGAWAILLSRYSGGEDVVFGATRACRHSTIDGAAEMVGLFINTLPLRVRVAPEAQLTDWLRDLRRQWIEMRPHEHTPLAMVQSWSEIRGGSALFDSIVVFENHELNAFMQAQDPVWTTRELRLLEQTNFGLTLAAYGGPELCLKVQFNRQRFDEASIARLLGHLSVILDSFTTHPHQRVGDVSLLTPAEHHDLIHGWNAGGEAFPPNPPLDELFAAQAARTPDAIVLVCGAEQLTYAQLDLRAEAVADHLRRLGVGPEIIVGLYLERSIDLIVGLLGILKAGGAYLPLDLTSPAERLGFMLKDAQAPAVLTHSSLASALPPSSARVVCIDNIPHEPPAERSAQAARRHSDSLAYIIYTSGSTGEPKGCCITHQNVTRLFASAEAWFRFSASDVWTMFHSIAFDFSVWEIWGALLHGGRLVIVPQAVTRAPHEFVSLLAREKVTVLNQTPSAFRQLIPAAQAGSPLTSLRFVIFGGEALELQSLAPWFSRHGDIQPTLVNMYGITETTVHVTYRPLCASDVGAGSPIGRPLPDLQVYILDAALRPVPIGVPGELFVGGAGVARGYLHRPELTRERFIESPFEPGARLYRTGDLGRFLPGRDIEYLGRVDQQVKIRGHRVELGEIEARVRQFTGVDDAVVVLREDEPGDQRLIAYVIGTDVEPVALREFLKEQLPPYMVPSACVPIDRLPLTTNGKLDLRALPRPQSAPTPHALPRPGIEQAIAEIWQEVLGLPRVGLDDSFFDLGGHSLLLIQVHGRLRARLALDLPVTKLFQFPTVRALARHLTDKAAASSTPSVVRDRATQQRAAITRQRELAKARG